MGRAALPKGSPQYISKLNKVKILNLIREKGKLSRADAAKFSEISAPTVTRIVDNLIRVKLIREIGAGVSSGGRRPTLLEFAGNDNYVIGIDLGTTHIYGVLANLNARIITELKIQTCVDDGFETIMHRTADLICELRNQTKIKNKKIFGVGLAVAGLVNRVKNIVEFSPDFHWSNADIVKILGQRCHMPIIFDNVTRVMALGELWYGIGEKIKNFIVINIGYGIGAGIVIDGRLLFGPKGMSGEFGHVTLERESKIRCECGNFGCLEALASGHAIAESAKQALTSGKKSRLQQLCGDDLNKISAEMVARAAKQDDALALDIFLKAADYMGIGIAGLINLFGPEAVVIGGGVAQAGDLLFDRIRKVVKDRALKNIVADTFITPATFGTNTAVMGAVALILNELLHLNEQVYDPENKGRVSITEFD